jgi:hypothetical protein
MESCTFLHKIVPHPYRHRTKQPLVSVLWSKTYNLRFHAYLFFTPGELLLLGRHVHHYSCCSLMFYKPAALSLFPLFSSSTRRRSLVPPANINYSTARAKPAAPATPVMQFFARK